MRLSGGKGWRSAATLVALLFLAAFIAAPALASDTMADRLIARFRMQKVPQEGVWFSVSYTSSDVLRGAALPTRYRGRDHAAGGAIVALETIADFSALHRLRTDETWHFYSGAPIKLLMLFPDGRGETVILGNHVLAGELPQYTVKAGVWQGSAPIGNTLDTYAFFGTQMAPAFDPADFEIGYRDTLQKQYPRFADQIERLTRKEFATQTIRKP